MEYHTQSPAETKAIGQRVGALLKGGEILAFSGDLGAGKTTFIQGLAEGIGITSRIISPTFIIMRRYETKKNFLFYHIDLYRLENNFDQELENIGIKDFWGREDSVVAIEWAEKVKDLLPESARWITIREEGDERIISVQE